MPKLKTKKTLTKRIKLTKSGKIMKKQVRTGHLKVKMDSSRRNRKKKMTQQTTKGYIKKLKRLLGKVKTG